MYLYLSVSHEAISAVLIREENKVQRPVYYVSQVLFDPETRYKEAEKMAYALVISERKLRPYFHARTIVVITNTQLRQVLHKPDTSGRLVKWAIELGELEIEFKPRIVIKAQVLADFLVEGRSTSDLGA